MSDDTNPCECGCGQDAGVYAATHRNGKAGKLKRFIRGHSARVSENKRVRPDCTIDGCNRPHKCRGLCSTHYARLLRRGDSAQDEPIRQMLPHPYRRCPICREIKTLMNFYPKGDGWGPCKNCVKASNRAGYAKNRDRRKREQAEYRAARLAAVQAYDRVRSTKAYAEAKQTGRCAWKQGRGCSNTAEPGIILCGQHRTIQAEKSHAYYYAEFERSYQDRGLINCWMCGGSFTAANPRQHDHLIPESLGGPDDAWNRAPAHTSCNNSRGNQPLRETVKRWHPWGLPDGPVSDAITYALIQEGPWLLTEP